MRILACTLAAAVALVGSLEPAEAAKPRKPGCGRSGSKTLLKNRVARVFEVEGAETRLYGCLLRQGRRVKLTETYDDDYVQSTTYSVVRLTGRFVAWQEVSSDVSCKAACPPNYDASTETIEVYDLRRRRQRSVTGTVLSRSLILTDRGAVAWAQRSSDGQVEVWTLTGQAGSRVDKGDIPARSLVLRGDTLVWTRDGVQQSTSLP